MNNASESVGTDHGVGEVDVPKTNKERYRQLKRRFKFLENECYQEELRNLQRKLLKLSRDKNFLLDRLLPYEKLSESSDDSDASISKTEEKKPKKKPRAPQQRKRPSTGANAAGGTRPNTNAATAGMKLASEMHASISAGALQTGPDAKKPKIEDLVAFPQATPEQRIDANQLAYEPVCRPIRYVQVCEGCKDLTVSVGTGRTTVKSVGEGLRTLPYTFSLGQTHTGRAVQCPPRSDQCNGQRSC